MTQRSQPAVSVTSLAIGDLARIAGCKVQTIRYYEQVGLLPKAGRTSGNQRIYGMVHAHRLAFIRHSRELGFPLDAIRQLLTLADNPNQSCATADQIARRQLEAVESRLARLKSLKTELTRMVAECKQGRVGDCHVIEVLADHTHAKCVTDHHADATDAA